jgi:hypothetical protein
VQKERKDLDQKKSFHLSAETFFVRENEFTLTYQCNRGFEINFKGERSASFYANQYK